MPKHFGGARAALKGGWLTCWGKRGVKLGSCVHNLQAVTGSVTEISAVLSQCDAVTGHQTHCFAFAACDFEWPFNRALNRSVKPWASVGFASSKEFHREGAKDAKRKRVGAWLRIACHSTSRT